MRGSIVIVSGPSGSGKSTLLEKLFKENDDLYFSISTTTRAPRENEQNGVDYFFVDKDEFEAGIKDDLFLEYANVHGNFYGTSILQIQQALNDDKIVIFDIDVQGQRIIKEKLGNIVTSVFITTPNIKVLEERLRSRKTNTEDEIQRRLRNARIEIERINQYDYLIVNDDLKEAFSKLNDIVKVARYKTSRYDLNYFVKKWENVNDF